MQLFYIIYHGCLYHDMNVNHDMNVYHDIAMGHALVFILI